MPLVDWFGKRLIGGANLLRGRARKFADAPDKMAALARLADRAGADAVICTGDLTALGTTAELAVARAEVEPFFAAPLGFLCIPGNHDVYTRSVIREQRFERQFADALGSDMPELATDGPWPIVRLLGEAAAVIAVNSARPTAPWDSSGRIPDIQLIGLRAALERDEISTRRVFIATHYAPVRADGSPDTPLHGLENANALLEVAALSPGTSILCGHIHHAFHVGAGPAATDVFCAGSATIDGHEAAWWFEIGAERATASRVTWNGVEWSPGEGSIDIRARDVAARTR